MLTQGVRNILCHPDEREHVHQRTPAVSSGLSWLVKGHGTCDQESNTGVRFSKQQAIPLLIGALSTPIKRLK